MGKTNIEYSDQVSNPLFVVDKTTGKKGTHCEKPDPNGTCRSCWAETLNTRGGPGNKRFGTGLVYDKSVRDRVEWHRHEKEMARLERLNESKPMSAKFPGNPLIVFTNDTYDLFQPSISNELRDWVFNNYDTFVNLTLLVQTTYVAAMKRYLMHRYPDGMPSHYFVGMSAGTQDFFDNNVDHLKSVPARRRYVIFEPLLERIEVLKRQCYVRVPCPEDSNGCAELRRERALDLFIIGGESGSNARWCDVSWIRDLVKAGRSNNLAILVKQLGSKPAFGEEDLEYMDIARMNGDGTYRLRDRKGGDTSEMPPDLRIREFPKLSKVTI